MSPKSQPNAHAPSHPAVLDEAEQAPSHYTSFILRCQITPEGGVLARLSEVRSGISYAVTDLDELPDLVRRRIAGDIHPACDAALSRPGETTSGSAEPR